MNHFSLGVLKEYVGQLLLDSDSKPIRIKKKPVQEEATKIGTGALKYHYSLSKPFCF